MYPAGTPIKVLRSDRKSKSSPRVGSIGYVSECNNLPIIKMLPDKDYTKPTYTYSYVYIRPVEATVIFTRFGNQLRSRHEAHKVIILEPVVGHGVGVTSGVIRAAKRLVDKDLSSPEIDYLQKALGKMYKLPWVIVESCDIEVQQLPLIDSLIHSSSFIQAMYAFNDFSASIDSDNANSPPIGPVPDEALSAVITLINNPTREAVHNSPDILKTNLQALFTRYKLYKLMELASFFTYIARELKGPNGSQSQFDSIVEDLAYFTKNDAVISTVENQTRDLLNFKTNLGERVQNVRRNHALYSKETSKIGCRELSGPNLGKQT